MVPFFQVTMTVVATALKIKADRRFVLCLIYKLAMMKCTLAITFGFLFQAALVVVDAFSVPPCLSNTGSSVPLLPHEDSAARIMSRATRWEKHRPTTGLHLSKRKGIETTTTAKKEQNALDYGKILNTLVNPGNPYSWFLYIFAFIIVYGTFADH
jgi:hypothetical protein